jgi:DNA-directed RNA polymerase subunit K/omega
MVHRSSEVNAFEFIRVASLRAAQLMRGCTPLVGQSHRSVLTAQLEVAAGKIRASERPDIYGMPAAPRVNDQLDVVPRIRR